ncbi:hypothetical protein LCGC14_0772860 [marine sediment metagenome]|uniref:LamG-like jellyroll fold domain-containing protein n=1 Tax=marine sediment metagenome TaxID=412755 RepID=A0A0F9PXY0_9ZZZZ
MSAQFDETNNVDLGTGLNVSGSEISVSARVYLDSGVGPNDARIMIKGSGTGADDNPWGLRISQSGDRAQFNARIGGTNIITSLAGVPTLSTGVWHHLVGVRRGNAVEIWVNGLLENSNGDVGGDIDTNTDEVWLGDQPPSNGRAFDGRIALPELYDRALTGAEILSKFNQQGLDLNTDSLLSRYLLDEETPGTTIGASVVVDSGPSREPNGSGELTPAYGSDEAIIFRRRYR